MTTSRPTKIIAAAVLLIGLAAAGPTVVTAATAAQSSNAMGDLANIGQVQQLSIAIDGAFAPSLDSLVSGELGLAVSPTLGSEVAYSSNQSRTHYIAATKIEAGGYAVGSDESGFVVCEEYTSECVSRVSSDAELVASVPVWITF